MTHGSGPGRTITVITALAVAGCSTPRPELAKLVRSQKASCSGKLMPAIGHPSVPASGLVAAADVERRVERILVTTLRISPAVATNASDLVCQAGADSLEIVEVVMALEEEFGLAIDDDDAEEIYNFPLIVSYVKRRLAEPDAA